ncbi:MAG: cytochrome C oxidase subunit IV family protein [Chloroflexi bacterium]|nr:cytochrome C oxidase subunit IV family protein [Chloroflexota bacterium]
MKAEPIVSRKIYFLTWISLLILLAITVGAASVDLGGLNTPVALGIAIIKAVLIILFFMHVHYSKGLLRIFAAAGFFWLLILIVLTMSDFASRGWFSP